MKKVITLMSLFLSLSLMAKAPIPEGKKPALDEKKPYEDSKIVSLDQMVDKNINGVKGVDLKRGKIIIDLKKVKLQEIRLENGEVLDMETYLQDLAESLEQN
jgi:hypothetical protein